MNTPSKKIDMNEFVNNGYLQEANRQFFHPLGLALAAKQDPKGNWQLDGVWDFRQFNEGIRFDQKLLNTQLFIDRANKVKEEQKKKKKFRSRLFKCIVQPIGTHVDPTKQ